MFIIVGLGNPGREYEGTRHNVGFLVLDKLAAKENISILEKKHKAIIGKGMAAGQKCVLAKPQTYMNLSGESVRQLIDFYKVDETAELIVISDDISLEVGQIRIRKKGSAGGHNGLKNIIAHLGHDSFIRVKMGVGEKPAGWDLVDYVLGHFPKEEREKMDQGMKDAVAAVGIMVTEGPDKAMNVYNKKKAKKPAAAEPGERTETVSADVHQRKADAGRTVESGMHITADTDTERDVHKMAEKSSKEKEDKTADRD